MSAEHAAGTVVGSMDKTGNKNVPNPAEADDPIVEITQSTELTPYSRFHFAWFQLSAVNRSLKIFNGKFQKEVIYNFKLHVVLSMVMEYFAVPLRPSWDINLLFVQSSHTTHPFFTESPSQLSKRVHVHLTLVLAYCYDWPILLFVIVVDLLIYKLNFIMDIFI